MRDWRPKPAKGLPEGLVLFDGLCGLCNNWVDSIIVRDKAKQFRFLALQTDVGEQVATQMGLDIANPQSNAVVLGGMIYYKSDAALHILKRLPGGQAAGLLLMIPRPLRNMTYDLTAKNRYRLAGRRATCRGPRFNERDRFILQPSDLQ